MYLFLAICFLVTLRMVFAEVVDFSNYEKQTNFLRENFLMKKEYSLPGDFISPLANYERQKLEKIVLKANQKTWSYVVKKGESLWSISRKFNIPIKDILAFNDLKDSSYLRAGDKIILPGVEPKAQIAIAPKKFAGKFVSALKEVGDIVIPVSGFNWGKQHSHNGSDIAAPCGQEVYAAQDGVVVESSDGWNSGYGNYIIIRHPDFSYTLYGHLSMRVVEVGETVAKGQLIGYVGNTGYTLGPTGCHLHFEIRGKTNPLLK